MSDADTKYFEILKPVYYYELLGHKSLGDILQPVFESNNAEPGDHFIINSNGPSFILHEYNKNKAEVEFWTLDQRKNNFTTELIDMLQENGSIQEVTDFDNISDYKKKNNDKLFSRNVRSLIKGDTSPEFKKFKAAASAVTVLTDNQELTYKYADFERNDNRIVSLSLVDTNIEGHVTSTIMNIVMDENEAIILQTNPRYFNQELLLKLMSDRPHISKDLSTPENIFATNLDILNDTVLLENIKIGLENYIDDHTYEQKCSM